MKFSLKRFGAIVTKEAKDVSNNVTSISLMIVPPLFAFLYSKVIFKVSDGQGQLMSAIFSILMAIAMLGANLPAMMISEEKEKNTMKVLMLSPANELEVFLGKSFLTLICTVGISILCLIITGVQFANLGIVILAVTLTSIFAILFGLIIGLVSPNEKATGVLGMPIMLGLLMPTLLANMKSEIIQKLLNVIPTYHMGEILFKIDEGMLFNSYAKNLVGIVISIVVAVVLFLVVYRKKKLCEN